MKGKTMKKKLTIAVDFDGTIVTHEYPKIGSDIGAFEVLKELQAAGHRLILFTMRSGRQAVEAVQFCRERGVEFWAVNVNPSQAAWSASRKVYAHTYIDDAALGCPLISVELGRPHVDWVRVREMLVEMGAL